MAIPWGARRICLDTDYYETYNRESVTLVDLLSDPLEAVTVDGLKTRSQDYPLDVLILATGFDAMTGALLNIDIRGRHGQSLREKWQDGPRSYLGLTIEGFPNLFTITGPGSPSVLSNMIASIEQHVEWIADYLRFAAEQNIVLIEATREAEDSWVQHVNAVADLTLFPKANTWYTGSNVPGKPRIFMPYVGGLHNYRKRCAEIAARGYEGFRLEFSESASRRPSLAHKRVV
ncbi:MAG: hypothetical protein WDN03_07265 [Rhizomicrobium sp.]